MYKEYKVEVIEEGACGTIFLGSARMPVKRLEAKLNEAAAEGWQVVFQVVEQRRFWLFWSKEAVVVTLGRPLKPSHCE